MKRQKLHISLKTALDDRPRLCWASRFIYSGKNKETITFNTHKMSHVTLGYIRTCQARAPGARDIATKLKLNINRCRYVQLCNKATPPAVVESTRWMRDQLSESTSLLLSSGLSADALLDLLHFWEFSDSSDDERFCLLHFARLFLNQTYVIRERVWSFARFLFVVFTGVEPNKIRL